MDDFQAFALACFSVVITIYAVRWYNDPLRAIPTVGGSSLPGLSYLGAFRMLGGFRLGDFAGASAVLVAHGTKFPYTQYPESAFKIPTIDRWMVVVSGRNMVEELRKRGDEELSGPGGFQETVQSKYIFEPPVISDEYHLEVVKEKLTRKLPALLPDVIDEVVVASKDHIKTRENGHNEKYLALAIDYTVDVIKSMIILRLFPRILKPVVALFVNYVKRDTSLALQYLQPIIEERRRISVELGEGWNDKPNDLLQFLLDKATTRDETAFVLAQRLLTLNFAAIHTSSSTVTHALYCLAEKPELLTTLREEIQANISADGWTSTAPANMWKLDSILRETLRYHGISLLSMTRKAMKDITLGDGTFIPKGTLVRANAHAQHHDDALLANAGTFDPFRYARMRAAEPSQSAKHQFTSTSSEYLPFGHGQHACPGRYLASHELKAILGYIILNYDLKLGVDALRPANMYVATGVMPAPRGCVLFKKREGPV